MSHFSMMEGSLSKSQVLDCPRGLAQSVNKKILVAPQISHRSMYLLQSPKGLNDTDLLRLKVPKTLDRKLVSVTLFQSENQMNVQNELGWTLSASNVFSSDGWNSPKGDLTMSFPPGFEGVTPTNCHKTGMFPSV